MALAKTKITGDGILLQDTGKLCLLEAVALQQGRLLLLAEQDVGGDQFVVRNVDEQILLQEALDVRVRDGRSYYLAGLGAERHLGDEDSGLEVLRAAVLDELLDDADADRPCLLAELHPQRACFGRRLGIAGRRRWGELFDHGLAGTRRELHLRPATG